MLVGQIRFGLAVTSHRPKRFGAIGTCDGRRSSRVTICDRPNARMRCRASAVRPNRGHTDGFRPAGRRASCATRITHDGLAHPEWTTQPAGKADQRGCGVGRGALILVEPAQWTRSKPVTLLTSLKFVAAGWFKWPRKSEVFRGPETGGRTWARTKDPLIKSQLLYQLSYASIDRGRSVSEEPPRDREARL